MRGLNAEPHGVGEEANMLEENVPDTWILLIGKGADFDLDVVEEIEGRRGCTDVVSFSDVVGDWRR